MRTGQIRILPVLLFTLFSLLFILKLREVQIDYQRSDKVINEDAFGYYLILPAFFKYHDPEFAFLDSVLAKTDQFGSYIPPVVNTMKDGEKVCKYYSGVAILQLPFYLLAQLSDNDNSNGFGSHYQWWILVSSAFYVLSGSWLYFRQMIRSGLSASWSMGILFLIIFGTNLYTYITYDPAYSHAYTFFAIACLCEALQKLKSELKSGTIFGLGLIFGLIAVIRPLNLYLIIAVPVFLGLRYTLELMKNYRQLSSLIAGLMIFPVFQFLIWHWQTGHWMVYPYGNEKLNLTNPRVFDFLFSYDCGWAVYTPSAFFALIFGIILNYLQGRKALALASLAGFSGLIYFLSSWYYLHYGCTAGCRPVTEYYGLIGLLLAKSLSELNGNRMIKWGVLPLLIMSFIYNRVVQYQFFNHIINWCDMDKQRFAMVFMRTHEVYRYSTYPFWDFSAFKDNKEFQIIRLNKELINDESFETRITQFMQKDQKVLISIRGKAKTDSKSSYLRILLKNDQAYVDQQLLLLMRKIRTDGQWHNFEFQFPANGIIRLPVFWIKLEDAGYKEDAELIIDEIGFRQIP